jgi:ArsR family transcriptional regulator
MESKVAISIMSALAQPTRLAVFATLAKAGAEGVTSGDLAERTGTPANTMSAHLLILTQAGLAETRRAGRNVFYTARPEAVNELAAHLELIASGSS